METVLLHNPRCSKSRAALALLEERGIPVKIRRYLEEPLDVPALRDLLGKLRLPVRDIIRSGESEYHELGLENADLDESTLLAALVEAPILLQRPILVRGDRAVIGRPPENILALL